MAIFETGAVTSIPNLLDALVTFCAANGWTVNSNAVEGSGRRAHLQLGSDVFINLRALVNEYGQGTSHFGGLVNGLAINGSTGYNGALAWYKQPGAPNTGITVSSVDFTYYMAGMMGISGAVSAYYFHARGNMIYVWIEYSTGLYQYMGFGRVTKYGAWTGGAVFFANGEGHANTLSTNTIGTAMIGSPPSGLLELSANANAFMYMTGIDGNTGWLPASNVTVSPAMPKFFCSFCLQSIMAVNIANQYNGLNVLLPCEICVTRDGTGAWANTTNFSIEGYLPDIHFICTRSLVAGQQLDDGAGSTYRIYPFREKSTQPGSTGNWFGVAIKEN